MDWCCCHYHKVVRIIISPAHGISLSTSSGHWRRTNPIIVVVLWSLHWPSTRGLQTILHRQTTCYSMYGMDAIHLLWNTMWFHALTFVQCVSVHCVSFQILRRIHYFMQTWRKWIIHVVLCFIIHIWQTEQNVFKTFCCFVNRSHNFCVNSIWFVVCWLKECIRPKSFTPIISWGE